MTARGEAARSSAAGEGQTLARAGRAGLLGRRLVAANDALFSRMPKVLPTLGTGAVLVSAVVGGLVVGGQAGMVADAAASAAGFELKKIEITGVAETGAQTVLDEIGVRVGQSLLLLDAEKARANVARIAWVESTTIRKIYPNRLVVEIAERVPYALWQHDGKVRIVDRSGHVIEEPTDPRHETLPLVVGEGADRRAAEAVAILESQPSLLPKVRAAVLVAERRWNVVTVDGVEIRLPERGAREAYADVAALDRSKKLLSRDVTVVDLRVGDRIALKLGEEAAEARRKAAEARLKAVKKGGQT